MGGKIRGAGLSSEKETVLLEVPVEGAEKTSVALFDDRCGLLIRAHDTQTGDLAFANHLLKRSDGFVAGLARRPVGKDPGSLGDVGLEPPAIVEHAFGEPLVRVVFEQFVEEGDHWIRRDHPASREGVLKAPDQRGGVGGGQYLALGVGQVEGGQERNLRRWQGGLLGRILEHHAVGNVPVAHQGAHLAGIGGARCAHHDQGCFESRLSRHGNILAAYVSLRHRG